MSFEKLREIMLVIGIGLFLTVALIIAFISTLNARKGGQTVIAVQDVLVKGFQKSDTVRNQSTIATFTDDLDQKQVGDLKINKDKFLVLNVAGDIDVQSGKITMTKYPAELKDTAKDGSILIAFIPSAKIKHGDEQIAFTVLEKATFGVAKEGDTAATAVAAKADWKKYNESLRGFMSSGYMSFWGFDKDAAKSYRDKFFPSGIVVEGPTGVFGIALEMAVN